MCKGDSDLSGCGIGYLYGRKNPKALLLSLGKKLTLNPSRIGNTKSEIEGKRK